MVIGFIDVKTGAGGVYFHVTRKTTYSSNGTAVIILLLLQYHIQMGRELAFSSSEWGQHWYLTLLTGFIDWIQQHATRYHFGF